MNISKNTFTPEDTKLSDDALHTKRFSHIETFYYDAVFENHYSIVALVNIFKIGNFGLVLTGMFLYNNSTMIANKRQRFRYHSLKGSEETPHITINDKDLIRTTGTENNKSNYLISMGNDREGFDLQFHQKTTAWKGKTPLGHWLAIPRFDVQGTLHIEGQSIPVKGKGYHDHNIYPFYAPLKIRGYHFGKIAVDPVTITWARIMGNNANHQSIVVVNRDQHYFSIPSNDIRFIIEKHKMSDGKNIPEVFSLKVKNDHLSLDVTLQTVNSHLIKMPLLHYWRSHLHVQGTIQIDSISKKIDEMEISEFMRFF